MKNLLTKYDFKSNLILKDLKSKERAIVENAMEVVKFKKGKMLFYEGGIPTGAFLITKGRVKIYKTGSGDRDQIFYIYKAGDLLGYHALLCDERYEDACEALENCETQFISTDKWEKLLVEIPALKTTLIKNMSHEFGVLVNIIAVLAQKSVRVRFALNLVLLHEKFEKKGINLSREDFANIVGTTRESLGRVIKDFKEEGLIEVNKRIISLKETIKIFEISKSNQT